MMLSLRRRKKSKIFGSNSISLLMGIDNFIKEREFVREIETTKEFKNIYLVLTNLRKIIAIHSIIVFLNSGQTLYIITFSFINWPSCS